MFPTQRGPGTLPVSAFTELTFRVISGYRTVHGVCILIVDAPRGGCRASSREIGCTVPVRLRGTSVGPWGRLRPTDVWVSAEIGQKRDRPLEVTRDAILQFPSKDREGLVPGTRRTTHPVTIYRGILLPVSNPWTSSSLVDKSKRQSCRSYPPLTEP